MTYSIVARDPDTGHFGLAVASRFFAAGALVPHIRGGVGAIATQAMVSPLYGVDGMRLLAEGVAPEEIVRRLTEADEGRAFRQLHLIDAHGNNAAYTGSECTDWAGHRVAGNVSVAGNILAGPEVVDDMLSAYQAALDLPLAERLLLALEAAEAAGGDSRGQQSAALEIYRDQDYPWLSIRTDDHGDPLRELRRLYEVAHEGYIHFADMLPTRANPHGVTDRGEFRRRIEQLEAESAANGRVSVSFATNRETGEG